MLKKTQAVIGSNSTINPEGALSSSIQDAVAVNTEYHAASDKYSLQGLSCIANYVFNTPSETYLKIKNVLKPPLQISFGCFGEAKSQIYPTIQ